ncbi:aspartate/glutamate racemase [soil metagenome]
MPGMRTLGIIGGMSWESTTEYYRLVNRGVAARLGGLHSASLLLRSVDFATYAQWQADGEWTRIGMALTQEALALERAGAELVLLATNTMHKVAPALEAALQVPFIHIVDPTAAALAANGVKRAALLGTRYTMESTFWIDRARAGHGVELIVPEADDRDAVHDIIYEELCRGVVDYRSRDRYVEVIGRLAARGAQAVILGCTEITLLIRPEDSPLPVFDTTALHAQAAVERMLGSDESRITSFA